MSRSQGDRVYSRAEGEVKKKRFDVGMSAKEAFLEMAPDLVDAQGRVEELELEQLGLVERQDVRRMRDKDFKGALVVDDEADLDAPLYEHVDGIEGIIFRVLHRRRQGGGGLLLVDEDDGEGEKKEGDGGGGGAGSGPGGRGGGGAGAGGGAAAKGSYFAVMMAGQRAVHRPSYKQADAAAKPIAVGFPSLDLAYNHAVKSLERHAIGFSLDQVSSCGWLTRAVSQSYQVQHTNAMSAQVKDAGKLAVETLRDVMYYMSCFITTLTEQKQGLRAVLAELGFFFIPATDPVAVAIIANPDSYDDKLNSGRPNLRVGIDDRGRPRPASPYHLHKYFKQLPNHPKREPRGGLDSHVRDSQSRVVGVSPATLGA